MDLSNSKRILPGTNYVVIELSEEEKREQQSKPGRAIEKLNFLRTLALGREDIVTIEAALRRSHEDASLRWMPELQAIAASLSAEQQSSRWIPEIFQKAGQLPLSFMKSLITVVEQLPKYTELVPFFIAFQDRMRASPVGRLHLERLEMYPIGIEQGELVFTVPMAPMEIVTISHKEWSKSRDEYETIVQDYFESYSERGVAEKSDVSMSSENETRHSNAFNFTATASGGYGPVTVSTSVGLTSAAEDRQAAKQSAQSSREVTQKASARMRQEHKVSVKLESSRGTEDASHKTLTNPHPDKAMRVDYFRMMRKWRTDLYRYGLRLTFDLMVPNPGARLWAKYRELKAVEEQLTQPFSFLLAQSGITNSNWTALSTQFGVALDPPLQETLDVSISRDVPRGQTGNAVYELVAPPGYEFIPVDGTSDRTQARATVHAWYESDIGGVHWSPPPVGVTDLVPFQELGPYFVMTKQYELHAQGVGERTLLSLMQGGRYRMQVLLTARAHRRQDAHDTWRLNCWTKLRDAEFARFQERQARLQRQRDNLWLSLTTKDTLSLRRMEREELIRGVLLWLLGPKAFEPAPDEVGKVISKLLRFETDDLPDNWGSHGGDASFRRLTPKEWATAASFGDFVRFIHHAIEWENILYFLYPYFWGSDDLGREKLLFDHPDALHRDFLRCGYARVVVPVRPGFEADLTALLDTGLFSGASSSPYVTIAEEVARFAKTNYVGIPPANPEKHVRPALYPEQRATWVVMERAIAYVEDYRKSNGTYPADLSGSSEAPFKDAWDRDLQYKMPGTGNDYDLFSLGADGVEGGEGIDADISAAAGATLIASWFDYTPSSGLDIEVILKPSPV